MWETLEKIEDKLSEKLGGAVRFSKESFYSGEERLFYKRLTLNEKPTGVRVSIMDLQEGERPVRVDSKVENIMKMFQLTKGV